MAVINQNGISGISSFNAKGDGIQVFNSDGSAGSITGLSGVNVSGVITATTFTGDGSSLTGIASTDNIRTNTNATFLQNVNVLGAGITVGNTLIQSHSIGIGTTDTTGRNAGVGTATGTLVYNATTQQVEVFDGTSWVGGLSSPFSATGGTKDTTSRSGYIVHTFTSPGSFIGVAGPGSVDLEYLVVAGGGGAGSNGGGGGAGGMRTGTLSGAAPGTYTIQVGGGGAGDGGTSFNNGTPSFISNPGITSVTSAGGGYGTQTGANPPTNGGPGGSGGGGAGYYGPQIPGGTGNTPPTSPPQGNNGGNGISGSATGYSGGGGGGAGAVGGNGSPTNGGNGGNGSPSSITGTSVTYAGGGGGNGAGTVSPGNSTGGTGGGGNGIYAGGAPSNPGAVNSGGGAGAGGNSASGGSGIVIIAYPTA